jgi:hypothetical protein
MKLIYLYLVASMLFLSSCSRYYYKPNAINTPLFTDGMQGHLVAAGSIGGDGDDGDRTTFADLQASFSPIKHLGLIGNYSTYNYTPSSSTGTPARAHLLEGGIGGYIPVGKRKVKMVAELYTGMGGGKLRSDVDMDVQRYFIQPGIGMRSPWVDAAFNFKWSFVNYSNLDDNGRGTSYLIDQQLMDMYGNNRIDKGTFTFLEPGFTVRGGYKFIKVQLQLAMSVPVSAIAWNYDPVRFTVGMQFSAEDLVDAINEKNNPKD